MKKTKAPKAVAFFLLLIDRRCMTVTLECQNHEAVKYFYGECRAMFVNAECPRRSDGSAIRATFEVSGLYYSPDVFEYLRDVANQINECQCAFGRS